MRDTTKAVLSDIGGLLMAPGGVAVTALVVAGIAGETEMLAPFAVTAAVGMGGGWVLRRLCRHKSGEAARAPLGTVAVAVGWIVAAVLCTIPFLWLPHSGLPATETSLAFLDVWNALFESMSALTSTGLSMASDPSVLPASIQWWRSSLEWVGGMGVVLLALTFVESHASRTALVASEINVRAFADGTKNAVGRLWITYAALTAASVALLWAVGMPAWEALNHGMTGLATGGFSVTPDGFAGYGPLVKAATTVVMTLGALDFAVYARAGFEREPGALWRDPMTRAFMAVFVVGAVLLIAVTAVRGDAGSWLDDVFMWSSALGTCGFASIDLTEWSGAAWWLLMGAMFVGAAAGSTGGGIKIRRAVVLVEDVLWQIRGRHDLTERRYRLVGDELDPSDAFERLRKASALLVVFLATLFLGALALLALEGDAHSPMALLFEAFSALGAVGISSGVTGTELGSPAKGVMVVMMWLGRLEVMAALMLIAEIVTPSRSDVPEDAAPGSSHGEADEV